MCVLAFRQKIAGSVAFKDYLLIKNLYILYLYKPNVVMTKRIL